jgi:hypothetical protein
MDIVYNGNKTFDVRERSRSCIGMRRDMTPPPEGAQGSRIPSVRDGSLVRGRREMYEAALSRDNNNYNRPTASSTISRGFSSDEEVGDEGFDETAEEEKQNRYFFFSKLRTI